MTEPLSPELAELFAAEKVAPAASHAARVALRARIARTVAHLPLGAAASVGVGKLLAILAVVVGAGTGTYALVRDHGQPAPVAPVTSIVAPVLPSPAVPSVKPVAPPTVAPVLPPVPPVVSVDAPSPRIALAKAPSNTLVRAPSPSEATLLAQAWSALESDAAHALELAHHDEALHPEGALREEREALEVVALAKLQRRSDAVAAASEFVKHHPNSVHRALVERSLRSEPSP
jgi:hypothetical protein